MKKLSLRYLIVIVLLVFSILFNAATWLVDGFSDLYTDNVFPVLTSAYGSITSKVSFSVGERMLILALILVIVSVIGLIPTLLHLMKKSNKPLKFFPAFYRVMSVIFAVVLVIMSINCFVLYHCTPIKVADSPEEGYTIEELTSLRDYIVQKCNALAEVVPHDEEGNVIYEGDMAETAKAAMLGISDEYKRLDGFYVTPKALTFSGFMSQQYMQGYYFPFSMEANYNDEMYIMNKPFTMCHELSHTHGYIYEDEANFLGFLACINSDDVIFQYSGYLGVLNYVNNDFYYDVDKETYESHVRISDQVRHDNMFLSDEAWERVEKNAILDTETVKKAADTFVDTNLKVNGVSSGKASYTHVVGLLLDYYSINPYN